MSFAFLPRRLLLVLIPTILVVLVLMLFAGMAEPFLGTNQFGDVNVANDANSAAQDHSLFIGSTGRKLARTDESSGLLLASKGSRHDLISQISDSSDDVHIGDLASLDADAISQIQSIFQQAHLHTTHDLSKLSDVEPYLISDYASQCQAYLGKVPEFSCTNLEHPNIEFASTLTTDVLDVDKQHCPYLFTSQAEDIVQFTNLLTRTCDITGSVMGKLKVVDAPVGTDVHTVFSCRKYDHDTQDDYFDDINIIQHDTVTGNTCWYNSAINLDLNQDRVTFFDSSREVAAYKDIDGSFVHSPMDPGADRFWLDPFDPDDVISKHTDEVNRFDDKEEENYVKALRDGRRGVMANMNCQRCHDSDVFLWTPIVTATFPISAQNPLLSPFTGSESHKGHYVSNFLGVFNADLSEGERSQVERFRPTAKKIDDDIDIVDDTIKNCNICHTYYGVNTMSRFGRKFEDDKRVVQLMEIIHDKTQRGIGWMPPSHGTTLKFIDPTDVTKEVLHKCAEEPEQEPFELPGIDNTKFDCRKFDDKAQKQIGLVLDVAVDPPHLIAGHDATYTASIYNRGRDAVTVLLTITNVLPKGVEFVDSSDNSTCHSGADDKEVQCELLPENEILEKGQSITTTVRVHVPASFMTDTLTNTIRISTPAETAVVNLKTMHKIQRNVVITDADLSLGQTATLQPDSDDPQVYRLTYRLTAHNAGPAVAASVAFSLTLPQEALFDESLSSPLCTLDANSIVCEVGTIDDGNSSSATVIADVPKSAGPFYSSKAQAKSVQDRNPLNNSVMASLFDPATVTNFVYMPLVTKQINTTDIDLIVQSIEIDNNTAKVTIKNDGAGTLLPGNGFWVDLYIDPDEQPVEVNDLSDADREDYGLVWGVLGMDFELGPGASRTFEIGDEFYSAARSRFPSVIGEGSTIFAQVDSGDLDNRDFGAILETHEVHAELYNNLTQFSVPNKIETAQWTTVSASSIPHSD